MDDIAGLCHSVWDCKYHVVMDTEIPSQGFVRSNTKGTWRSVSPVGGTEGRPDTRRISGAGSCAYVRVDSAEVCCGADGWFCEGEESDPYSQDVWRKVAQFYRGEKFWARGYLVSTVGRDEKVIREYILRQEQEDKRLDQLRLIEEPSFRRLKIFDRFDRFIKPSPHFW